MASSRIPFDSFTLSAVVAELSGYVGGRVQGIRQPGENEVAIALYANGTEAMLLLSCDPNFARAHFITKRPSTLTPPPAFCATLRARIDGTRLVEARQVEGDRVLELIFEGGAGIYRLIAELMGKHSNLILIDPAERVVAAAKWVGRTKSSRPIQSGTPYLLPPVMQGGEGLKASPFYRSLVEALGHEPRMGNPVISPGHGAYPCSVAALGLPEFSRRSVSIALENYYEQAIPQQAAEALRGNLTTQLRRIVIARDVAIDALREALDAADKANRWQRLGELLLAYGPAAPAGGKQVDAWDYDGTEVQIKVDPELDFKANAAKYFDRAKRAKARRGVVEEQFRRLDDDRQAVRAMLARVEGAKDFIALEGLRDEALKHRWLNIQAPVAAEKDERPYQGLRVRELLAPGGWTILYGENAEANDYLTLRVAKPNDWWLHIRGGTSAHVVIVTRNQPDRVQRETFEFAAKVAVRNSPSKHSGYVPVDYTLKKHVRKPKGAARGGALYTHEKTLHVSNDE